MKNHVIHAGKLLLALSITFTGLFLTVRPTAFAQNAHNHESHPSQSEPAATHGMLIFGQEQLYVSHLPMFHQPHDYQAIFEIALNEQALKVYLESKKNNPNQTVYTIVPQPFVLSTMISNPTSFKAKLFIGHFERDGKLIEKNVTVSIKKVVFSEKLNAGNTPAKTYEAIVFGNSKELFMAHKIDAKPSFDQISEIALNPSLSAPLANHNFLTAKSSHANRPFADAISLSLQLEAEQAPIAVDLITPLYTETGDLEM